MPRYDKYDPISGGFRAPLNADLTFSAAGEFGPLAVSLNTSGRAVVGTQGASGVAGILVKNVPFYPRLGNVPGQLNAAVPIGGKAGDIVDIMTSGEILGVPTFTAGQKIYAIPATGVLTATATGNIPVGFMAEAGRLIVRVTPGAVAAP